MNDQRPSKENVCTHGISLWARCAQCERQEELQRAEVTKLRQRIAELERDCTRKQQQNNEQFTEIAQLKAQLRRSVKPPAVYATARQSAFDPSDYNVEWPDTSVGSFSESEARMWAAHMNEAYAAGRASQPLASGVGINPIDSPRSRETDGDLLADDGDAVRRFGNHGPLTSRNDDHRPGADGPCNIDRRIAHQEVLAVDKAGVVGVDVHGDIDRASGQTQPPSEDRLDAERYRWLRHGDNDNAVIRGDDAGTAFLPRNEKLDEAIDSERGALTKQVARTYTRRIFCSDTNTDEIRKVLAAS